MVGPVERFRENASGVVALLVLGAGLTALFAGIEFFWAIWVVGFAAVVPLVALLFDGDPDPGWSGWPRDRTPTRNREGDRADGRDTKSTDEALQALRERYARGELTDEQFERKVERLLETETVEDVESGHVGERARERE